MRRSFITTLCTTAILLCSAGVQAADTVKVFLMWGQSNMEGKGRSHQIPYLIEDPEKGPGFKHLMDGDEFAVREDVWVWFSQKYGDLGVGYGGTGKNSTSGNQQSMFGPELGFGHVIGDKFGEQVLLIKCAWGGKSLAKDFLPPGSGGPGPEYELAMKQTKEVLGNLGKYFPDHKGGYEVSGMVWFQGWNDLKSTAEYTDRLAQLIKDVRQDLDVPNLPVVIGESGQGGAHETKPGKEPSTMVKLRRAQQAVAELPEFKGTVSFVPTKQFHIPELEKYMEIYNKCKKTGHSIRGKNLREMGLTRQEWQRLPREEYLRVRDQTAATEEQRKKGWEPWNAVKEEWQRVGGDGGFHFFGSAEIFYYMGEAFGNEMIKLID
ncbi:MAG: sialate O-acetylesterase [Planctomycetota bacterium]